jgi:arabinan endo-1,5-alpha-L-arabinosidase
MHLHSVPDHCGMICSSCTFFHHFYTSSHPAIRFPGIICIVEMTDPKSRKEMHERTWLLLLLLVVLPGRELSGLHGATGAHDPTGIRKCGNTYWVFTTGYGIYSIYSHDLIYWTPGETPFARNAYPAWINTYVPGFEGHFWAPECVFMNGKYYLYYSCSTWGSKNSCIGLVTNTTLNPQDPGYSWEDQGVVVYSDQNSEANCIDPSVFRDGDGEYYLTYGSYFGGIRIVELDSVSGKLSGSYRYPVASGDCEASCVIPHDGWYYLFINRGQCCQGVNSTYYIQAGRSESPVGPFLDKDGADLDAGGGTTILGTNGNFIGPGHVGYYVEQGGEWVTYHYYDGDRGGVATLAIGTVEWETDGWPRITNDFIDEGKYVLVNHNSQMVWQVGGAANEGSEITQGTYVHGETQQWQLTPVGNGYYSITEEGSGLVVETEGCSGESGAGLVLGTNQHQPCAHWRFERSNILEFVISSKPGNYVVDVPPPSYNEGAPLEVSIYSGTASHYWTLADTSLSVSLPEARVDKGLRVFPNPSSGGTITIRMETNAGSAGMLDIYALDGRSVYRDVYPGQAEMRLDRILPPGLYSLKIVTGGKTYEQKFVVL